MQWESASSCTAYWYVIWLVCSGDESCWAEQMKAQPTQEAFCIHPDTDWIPHTLSNLTGRRSQMAVFTGSTLPNTIEHNLKGQPHPPAPSSTRFAISVASARVGRGASVMLSTTRVMNTGLPTSLATWINIFCNGAAEGRGLSTHASVPAAAGPESVALQA